MRQTEKTFVLTAQEVASILGVSAPRVLQLANEGRIKYRSVGPRDRLYDATSLAAFIVERDMKSRLIRNQSSDGAESQVTPRSAAGATPPRPAAPSEVSPLVQ